MNAAFPGRCWGFPFCIFFAKIKWMDENQDRQTAARKQNMSSWLAWLLSSESITGHDLLASDCQSSMRRSPISCCGCVASDDDLSVKRQLVVVHAQSWIWCCSVLQWFWQWGWLEGETWTLKTTKYYNPTDQDMRSIAFLHDWLNHRVR